MSKPAVATISYFSDVLCVWAYAAQIKLDEMRRQFGDQIRVEYHFLPLFGDVYSHIDAGWRDRGGVAAYAALCADFDAKQKHLVEGSPTFLLNAGRQKLFGNVGYRIIEANIQELLADPGERASWC